MLNIQADSSLKNYDDYSLSGLKWLSRTIGASLVEEKKLYRFVQKNLFFCRHETSFNELRNRFTRLYKFLYLPPEYNTDMFSDTKRFNVLGNSLLSWLNVLLATGFIPTNRAEIIKLRAIFKFGFYNNKFRSNIKNYILYKKIIQAFDLLLQQSSKKIVPTVTQLRMLDVKNSASAAQQNLLMLFLLPYSLQLHFS